MLCMYVCRYVCTCMYMYHKTSVETFLWFSSHPDHSLFTLGQNSGDLHTAEKTNREKEMVLIDPLIGKILREEF